MHDIEGYFLGCNVVEHLSFKAQNMRHRPRLIMDNPERRTNPDPDPAPTHMHMFWLPRRQTLDVPPIRALPVRTT